ncbi:MAG: hypothetical protein U5L96_15780 [Owenweeksia sp.]|nr:hypothetical protein [Owenweeksia sp.]
MPLFFIGYYLMPDRLKNAWALLGSAAFYTWGAPLFVSVLFASIAADYWLVRQFGKGRDQQWLWLALLLNIGLLAYFKYANFFVDNVNGLLAEMGFNQVSWTMVVLPIGISFFTFQKISYVVDVSIGACERPLSVLRTMPCM